MIGAAVGGFVASDAGLGNPIVTAGVTPDTPAMFAPLVLIALLGLGPYGAVALPERVLVPWEFREAGG